jgi:SAM-dependent methyltransferase
VKAVSDPEYWELAYAEHRDQWELGQPAPPLVRALRPPRGMGAWVTPDDGPVLVPGCGRGHEARLAAEAGWRRVVGVDFAEKAIAEAKRFTPPNLASRIEWRREDLFTVPVAFPGAFSLVIEHVSFCAIDPSRRGEWFAVMRRVLRPGGRLLGLFYVHGREGGPPFGATREEIERLAASEGKLEVERVEVPEDSVGRRRGEELLVLLRRSTAQSVIPPPR